MQWLHIRARPRLSSHRKHSQYAENLQRAHDTSFVYCTPTECLRWLDNLVRALIVCSQCICLQQRKANRVSDLHFEASNQCHWRESIHSARCRFLTGLETIDNELQQLPKVTVHESERRHNWKEKKWLCVQFVLLGKAVRDRDKRRVFRLLFGEHFLERSLFYLENIWLPRILQ